MRGFDRDQLVILTNDFVDNALQRIKRKVDAHLHEENGEETEIALV